MDKVPGKHRGSTESPMRGGDEKEVEKKVQDTEQSADSLSDSDSDTTHPVVKTIEDFIYDNNDPPADSILI